MRARCWVRMEHLKGLAIVLGSARACGRRCLCVDFQHGGILGLDVLGEWPLQGLLIQCARAAAIPIIHVFHQLLRVPGEEESKKRQARVRGRGRSAEALRRALHPPLDGFPYCFPPVLLLRRSIPKLARRCPPSPLLLSRRGRAGGWRGAGMRKTNHPPPRCTRHWPPTWRQAGERGHFHTGKLFLC